MQLITVTRGRDSGRVLGGISYTPLQQFCAVLQVSTEVAEHLLTKLHRFNQTQRKKDPNGWEGTGFQMKTPAAKNRSWRGRRDESFYSTPTSPQGIHYNLSKQPWIFSVQPI